MWIRTEMASLNPDPYPDLDLGQLKLKMTPKKEENLRFQIAWRKNHFAVGLIVFT